MARGRTALAEKKLVMKEWVFVHNDPDDLAHDVVIELARLQQDNPNVNLGNLQFSDYLFSARKYAREQDVKGGR